MAVTVRLFAGLREIAGGELVREMALPATVDQVWAHLTRDWPALAPYRDSVSCAVNAEYARFSDSVREGDEVAFMPPVSGG